MSRPKPYQSTEEEQAAHLRALQEYAYMEGGADRRSGKHFEERRFHSTNLQDLYAAGWREYQVAA